METCDRCGNPFPMGGWPFCPDHERPHGAIGRPAHVRERAVVYYNAATGKVAYPPRNDQPMPAMYAANGYERRELPTLRDIHKLEREQGVRSETAWFDHGTGNADKLAEPPKIDMTGLEFGNKDA